MATYTPNDAVDYVKSLVHGIPVDTIKARACDQVNSIMWAFYPWSWTLNNLTAINLTNGVQDYTPTNTDILRPIRMQISRTDTTPAETRELALLANLSPELTRLAGINEMAGLGWYAANNFFRFDRAVSVGSGQTLQLVGIYQKNPTKITNDNMDTALLIPDYYFNVFVDGILWQLYRLGDDPRAGTAQFNRNGAMSRIYTGQYGIFMDALLSAARTEDLANGDDFSFPETGFGVGRSYWPGLYGI